MEGARNSFRRDVHPLPAIAHLFQAEERGAIRCVKTPGSLLFESNGDSTFLRNEFRAPAPTERRSETGLPRPRTLVPLRTFKEILIGVAVLTLSICASAAPPIELRQWLNTPQNWQRDTDGPIVSLGEKGRFDDTHIFAPTVIRENGKYLLWYCGSTADVANRVFKVGLVTGTDGKSFTAHANNPVYSFGDDRHSVLTPIILRHANGAPMRENGKLRMWFSSTHFAGKTGAHKLHESFSDDGIHWDPPSGPLADGLYAPTIIKIGRWYQMWFTDVSKEPWIIRHAASLDGRKWGITTEPCIEINQPWESQNLFYPHVIYANGVYHMWYGSYWNVAGNKQSKTALGYATSIDGLKWYKHPNNPVFKPDESRPWESHYTTSHSVIYDEANHSMRIWYASRTKPPFINKYFALNTAVWSGVPPQATDQVSATRPEPKLQRDEFLAWQNKTRMELRAKLGIPKTRVPLNFERRESLDHDGIRIEKFVFTSETGSRVPALIYSPIVPRQALQSAIVLTYGHGGSKSAWQYHYAGQLYAKLGLVCLAIDPIGEEERHKTGRMGSRAHDPQSVHERAVKAGRPIMGKLVFDTLRGIDLLIARGGIDTNRIGVAGNSLGGATAGWMLALEPRIRMAIVCGWAFDNIGLRTKYCTKHPNQIMREDLSWSDYLALGAPHCATLVMNGDADWIIDREGDNSAWQTTDRAAASARLTYSDLGAPGSIATWYEPGAGHRPYFVHKRALEWIHTHLSSPSMSLAQIRALPNLNGGKYCDANGIKLERLYGTDLHQRGATLADLGIQPLTLKELAVLKPDEVGKPEFTIEGWLDTVEKK